MSHRIPEYVKNSGGSIVSKNVLERRAPLRWAFREKAVDAVDNGWRFLSEIDDDDYINDPANLQVVSFNTVVDIEPAVLPILYMPVGTDLTITRDEAGRIQLVDNKTGAAAAIPGVPPPQP
ncbi:DUF2185 domain-containing protein [Microbacterium sp. RG1]|uniref:DUF2185 domain-containing protein n=1 Tax=Microbacterium sp. RG1 TaxID=2489212 RepID=UPI0010CA5DFB|nr:DUF2185 domain-containing protein [Microbacterium sp. RG1]QCQ17192.1 DUF2185 domain-containing protein [Microbacterium sp. RG1]